MRKYVVEVRRWIKQVRPGGRSGECEMTIEEARGVQEKLIGQGVVLADVRIRPVE